MMGGLLHRLRHRLDWQPIEVVSEWRNDRLWIGARCVVCGEITGWHDATHVLPPPPNANGITISTPRRSVDP